MGIDTGCDSVCPDLAFSLPSATFPAPLKAQGPHALAIGVMDYRKRDGAGGRAAYAAYIGKTARLVALSLNAGYQVHIIHGDLVYDREARHDLKAEVERLGICYAERQVVDAELPTVQALLSAIASCDIVISPRFHNQLLALMMSKAVIAISYDGKTDALLRSFSLQEYCHQIDTFSPEKVASQIDRVVRHFEESRADILSTAGRFRSELQKQYDNVLRGI
jgi:polysaccharide pyruvyl transferase WcaK-like protein